MKRITGLLAFNMGQGQIDREVEKEATVACGWNSSSENSQLPSSGSSAYGQEWLLCSHRTCERLTQAARDVCILTGKTIQAKGMHV